MKRSIQWPPRVVGGRLQMTPDPEDDLVVDRTVALRQLIALSVQDGRSGNPWNTADQLGVNDATFAPATIATQATIKAQVKRQFGRLERERRARLVAVTVAPGQPGELRVDITYIDLETQERLNMEIARHG